MTSLLSVKQDLTHLTSELSDSSVVPERDQSVTDVSPGADDAGFTVDEADCAKDAALDEVQYQRLDDELQPDKHCDVTSEEHCKSASCGLQCDKFSNSSSRHEDGLHRAHLSKKTSVKRKSAERTGCGDSQLTSEAVKKLRHKTEMSTSRLVKTSSGTFVVHEVTEPGEELMSDSNILCTFYTCS